MNKGTNYPRIATNGQQFHVFILLVYLETRKMKNISREIDNQPRKKKEHFMVLTPKKRGNSQRYSLHIAKQ